MTRLPLTYKPVTLNREECYEVHNPNNSDTYYILKSEGDQVVHIPSTGKCYHFSTKCASCIDVKETTTMIEANARWYRGCSKCRPHA